MNDFLSRFRGILLEFGKSQKEICDELGIRTQKLSNWKTGYSQPSFDDLIMLANYFKISVDYLLGREDDFGNVNVQGSVPALSPDEKKLLDDYRALNTKNRMHVSAYASIRREEQEDGALKRG